MWEKMENTAYKITQTPAWKEQVIVLHSNGFVLIVLLLISIVYSQHYKMHADIFQI